MKNDAIFFLGSAFEHATKGGQLYNGHVARHLAAHYPHFETIDYPWSSLLKSIKFDIATAWKVATQRRPTLIIIDESLHQRMALTTFLSLLNPKIKVVLMLHQLAFTRRTNKSYYTFTRLVDSAMIRLSDLVISAGFCVADIAKSITPAKHHKKIQYALATPQQKQNLIIEKKPFHVCFVGSIVEAKGIMHMIEAVNLLGSALKYKLRIYLAGSLADREFVTRCKAKIASYKLQHVFIFCGQKNWAELEKLYGQSEAYLFPSLSENMPMSLMEAMAARSVPICFNISAMPYFIENKNNGYLVAPKNEKAYAEAIEIFFGLHDQEKQLMGNKSAQTVQKYIRPWHEVATEIESHLKTL